MKIVLIAAVGVLVLAVGAADYDSSAADKGPDRIVPFPAVLFDLRFLSERAWRADDGLDAATTDWSPYSGDQGFKEKTVLRHATVSVLGRPFTAEYRLFKADSSLEIAVFGAEYDEGFCSALFEFASRRLGDPAKMLQTGKAPNDESFAVTEADWEIGEGRLRMSCAGLKIGDAYLPAIATMVYRHKTKLKALADLVFIECSSTRKFVGRSAGEPVEEAPPVAFIIDPNRDRILGRNRQPFLETKIFTAEEIVASKVEKYSMTFRLDRVTGNYELRTRLKDDNSTGLDQWGKCSRIEPSKKF